MHPKPIHRYSACPPPLYTVTWPRWNYWGTQTKEPTISSESRPSIRHRSRHTIALWQAKCEHSLIILPLFSELYLSLEEASRSFSWRSDACETCAPSRVNGIVLQQMWCTWWFGNQRLTADVRSCILHFGATLLLPKACILQVYNCYGCFWLFGLGLRFSIWAQEVLGSNRRQANVQLGSGDFILSGWHVDSVDWDAVPVLIRSPLWIPQLADWFHHWALERWP